MSARPEETQKIFFFYEIKVLLKLSKPAWSQSEIFLFKYIDDVIPRQLEVPFSNDHIWKFEVTRSRICGVTNEQIKR